MTYILFIVYKVGWNKSGEYFIDILSKIFMIFLLLNLYPWLQYYL